MASERSLAHVRGEHGRRSGVHELAAPRGLAVLLDERGTDGICSFSQAQRRALHRKCTNVRG